MVLKCNNQLKAIEKIISCFLVMFSMLNNASQLLRLCMKSLGVTIQTNATELPGPGVLFIILFLLLMFSLTLSHRKESTGIILYKVVLTLESVYETLEC